MSLAKEAQMNLDGFSIPVDDKSLDLMEADDHSMIEGQVMLQLGDDEKPKTFDFKLPMVPGLDPSEQDLEILEEVSDLEVEEEQDEVEVEEQDPWAWKLDSFLDWLQGMLKNIPQHRNETAGLERTIAYLENLDKEISKAVRADLKNQIAIDAVENARDEIHKGLDKLYDRLEKVMENKGYKRKKKASEEIAKTAGKATRINGISVTVPLFISGVVRTCLNSMISAGKDVEDCFQELVKKYDMTDREIFEAIQLFSDMGYAIRRPRGYNLDEEIDYTSTDNLDYMANYPG